jgi:hypothetical protein
MYEHRNFVIFDTTELSIIDFTQVLETSAETVRVSTDGTKTFVKWDGEAAPLCVENLTTKSEYYTHSEMLEILTTEEWTSPMEDI